MVKLVILLVVKESDKKVSLLVVVLNLSGDLAKAENVFRISMQKQEKKQVDDTHNVVRKDAHSYVALEKQHEDESPVTLTQPVQRDLVQSNKTWFAVD